jgi:hypothetical protein
MGEKMQNYLSAPFEMFSAAASFMSKYFESTPKLSRAAFMQARAARDYWNGIFKYSSAFMGPSENALSAFMNAEKEKLIERSPAENLEDYSALFALNVRLACASMTGSLRAMSKYYYDKLGEAFSACLDTLKDGDGLSDFASRLEETLRVVVHEYPRAIDAIEPEYGFHLDSGGYVKVAETERFYLYQVLPQQKEVSPRNKPILIIPPYVLGANILAFLPGEQRSYVHCYANQGVPTYIRLVKDIRTTPAVQIMTGEDDALDTRFFCRQLVNKHGKQVTLNGFCQGGYQALTALLAGELDDLVDALITCVTPVDGSRSKSLIDYMESLPKRFRDPRYSYKKLPNGNEVVDSRILSWVYKLRKLETESPIASFHRDIDMIEPTRGQRARISKTAAGINHWITYDQQDLPIAICRMSYDSYTIPIDEEGTLPVTLFGRKLNLKRLEEKKIPWLICIADDDDLVDKQASLAALDYIDAEVSIFPKGHAALATSWSIPTSACAPHLRYRLPNPVPSERDKVYRGPVCFQIDLDEMDALEPTGAPGPTCGATSLDRTAITQGTILLAPIPGYESRAEDAVEEKQATADVAEKECQTVEKPEQNLLQEGGAEKKPKKYRKPRSSKKTAPPKSELH